MPATLDLPAVRRFTDDLTERLRRCDNGEGSICSNLDQMINHYVQLFGELRTCVNDWARSVFTSRIEFDQEVENVLKAESRYILRRAKQIAAQGRAMGEECFALEGLNALHFHIADFDYLLENWVSPRRSVSPAPRLRTSTEVELHMLERLKRLPMLSSDWKPTDPEQFAFFKKQRGE